MSYFPMGKTGSIVRIKQKISRLKVNRHWSRTFQALWCLFWRSPSSFSRLKICMATGQPHCWSVRPASASVPTRRWTEHHKATRKTPHASSSPSRYLLCFHNWLWEQSEQAGKRRSTESQDRWVSTWTKWLWDRGTEQDITKRIYGSVGLKKT